MTKEALKAIAHLAMERKTGARGLRAIMVCCGFNSESRLSTNVICAPELVDSLKAQELLYIITML